MRAKFSILIISFFAPISAMILLIGLAILCDTLAGRWSARIYAKNNNIPIREWVTSRRTKDGVIHKVIAYNLAFLTFYLIDRVAINEIVITYIPFNYILTKIVALFIVWLEFDSIDEKYYNVNGVRITDKIKDFFKRIKEIINYFSQLFRKKNEN